MKKYIVRNTPLVEKKLERYVDYLLNAKKSVQAAQALLKDFSDMRKSLETTAGMLRIRTAGDRGCGLFRGNEAVPEFQHL